MSITPIESLPSEIILHIVLFLEPLDIVTIQSVSKRFLALGRDDGIWREQCFNSSTFLSNLRRRRNLLVSQSPQESRLQGLARALAAGNGLGDSRLTRSRAEARDFKGRSNERIRMMENWDPSYPDEKVCWYDEYLQRHAPIITNYMQQPRNRDSAEHEHLEARGMGIYTPRGQPDASMVVSPLDDGSVCLWDIKGSSGRKQGSIISRSKSGLVSLKSGSGKIGLGVTECVSVDSYTNRAYFALQSSLIEVDLKTLTEISQVQFPFPITTLSEAKHPIPLTVGTNLAIYLHDPRTTAKHDSAGGNERLDLYSEKKSGSLDFRSLLNPEPSPFYDHLQHPGPLSILHMPTTGSEWDGNGDIYVAGRFSNILNYDRRYFPRLRGTIFSGARLCSMASMPFSFASMEKDLARRGELSIEQVRAAKERPGKTLIACGEYNSKGSLEMYGLSADPSLTTISSDPTAGRIQNSVMKNRQTSSSSKLLSVCNHGTRIVVSDGGGNLKWLERDGFTEARKWNVAHKSVEAPRGIFGSLGDSYMDSAGGDIVLRIANTHSGSESKAVNEDSLVFWTGEKIGLLSFSSKSPFTAESFEDTGPKTAEDEQREMQERTHAETMKRALEANANEVRWLRGLGLA